MKESQKRAIRAGLDAIANLEAAIVEARKHGHERLAETMLEGCKVIEQAMDANEDYMEKHYDEWEKQMMDISDKMIGQILQAQWEMQSKK